MQHAADDLNLEMRGTSGEGSEAIGHLHQISNRRTLGVDEEDLLRFLEEDFLARVVREERRARDTLLSTRREFLDDRVQRAFCYGLVFVKRWIEIFRSFASALGCDDLLESISWSSGNASPSSIFIPEQSLLEQRVPKVLGSFEIEADLLGVL